ncbi:MAG TPA: DUF4287 domain-containing protein [Streptosporangiaceae bacterium]
MRYLCLLIGEPDIKAPVPGTPEFARIRNIGARYGRPLSEWFGLISASGLTKHTEVVAMLKAEHGMAHSAAHRVSLLSRQAAAPSAASLILPGVPAAGRLEPSGSFNALFTHRVRVTSADDLDDALAEWLASAYAAAG